MWRWRVKGQPANQVQPEEWPASVCTYVCINYMYVLPFGIIINKYKIQLVSFIIAGILLSYFYLIGTRLNINNKQF